MKKLTLISLSTDSLKKTTKEFPFPAVQSKDGIIRSGSMLFNTAAISELGVKNGTITISDIKVIEYYKIDSTYSIITINYNNGFTTNILRKFRNNDYVIVDPTIYTFNKSAKTFTYRGNRVKDAGFELGELVIYEEYVGVIYDYLINEREFIDGKKEKELN